MVILCGFHRSGKSSVGRYLANRMGCPIFDTDRLMEAQNGVGSVRELHQAVGESRFRELEAAAIRLLPTGRQMVIATGGGALLNPTNAAELNRRGQLCFLDVSWEVLKARWRELPSFATTWREAEEIYGQRRALYQSQVKWQIEVTDQSIQEIAALIFEGVRYGIRPQKVLAVLSDCGGHLDCFSPHPGASTLGSSRSSRSIPPRCGDHLPYLSEDVRYGK